MGKKGNLLTEAQVRQFMKLANLAPLTPGFVHGLNEADASVDWDDDSGPGQAPPPEEPEAEEESDAAARNRAARSGEGGKNVKLRSTKPMSTAGEIERSMGTVSKAQHQQLARKRAASKKHKEAGKGEIDYGQSHVKDPEGKKVVKDPLKLKPGSLSSGEVEHEVDVQGVKESHGRGRGEGAAGYGRPDDNGRAGQRLREELPPEEEGLDPLDELPPEDPLDELPPEGEEDLEGLEGGGREVSVDDFLAALEVALEDVLGDEVEVEQDEDDEELDLGPEEEPLPPEGELPLGDEELPLQEMINTITKRVAKRIVREALQKKK